MMRTCDEIAEMEEIRRFKSKSTFAERKTAAKKHLQQNPEFVPLVLLGRDDRFKNNEIFKVFINRKESTCKVVYYLKRKLKMKDSEGALFLIIDGNITPKLSTSLDCLYNLYKDDDDLLYMVFDRQNFLG